MKKIILFILMFCSFSYVAAFDKVWNSGFDEPVDYIFLSQSEKNLKIKGGTRSEFPAVALSISDFSDATATLTAVAMKGPISMINIAASGFKPLGIELFASSNADYPYKLNGKGYLTEQASVTYEPFLFKPMEKTGHTSFTDNAYKVRTPYDVIYYTSASDTDANNISSTATTLIKNTETIYFSFAYNIDKERTPYDAIYYTSVVAADKYAKPTIKIATIATKNEQYAKGCMYTDGKTLSSVSSMIATNDNAEIKNVAGKEIVVVGINAYTSSIANIGNEYKPVAGSKIDTMALGHSDYGA